MLDIKPILVQGFARESYTSKNGKIKFTVRSTTMGDKLTSNGEGDASRGMVMVAGGLESFGEQKFSGLNTALPFVEKTHTSIVKRIKKVQDDLDGSVMDSISDWVARLTLEQPSVEDIVKNVLNGDRVLAKAADPEIPFSIIFQTLTLEEETYATVGYDLTKPMSPALRDQFEIDILQKGIHSINEKAFGGDNMELFKALQAMPYALVVSLFGLHVNFSDRVKGILQDDENF